MDEIKTKIKEIKEALGEIHRTLSEWRKNAMREKDQLVGIMNMEEELIRELNAAISTVLFEMAAIDELEKKIQRR